MIVNVVLKRRELKISDLSMYIHSVYWAYVTSSHVGVGDVTGVNIREKVFSIVVMFVTTFTHLYFFGNLASIAKEVVSLLKKKFNENYQTVVDCVKQVD